MGPDEAAVVADASSCFSFCRLVSEPLAMLQHWRDCQVKSLVGRCSSGRALMPNGRTIGQSNKHGT